MQKLRLTFNKPTVKPFVEGDEAVGFRIGIKDGAVQFLPVSDLDSDDVLPISFRSRGGAEATIEGDDISEIVEALDNPHSPFFTLTRVKGGWLEATPWTKSTPPPKFEPHVRLWFPRDQQPKRAAAETSFAEFAKMVTDAQKTIEKFSKVRKAGRPPREVAEAKAIIDQFRNLVSQVQPKKPIIDQIANDPEPEARSFSPNRRRASQGRRSHLSMHH